MIELDFCILIGTITVIGYMAVLFYLEIKKSKKD